LLVGFPSPCEGALGGFLAGNGKGQRLGVFGLQYVTPLGFGFSIMGFAVEKWY